MYKDSCALRQGGNPAGKGPVAEKKSLSENHGPQILRAGQGQNAGLVKNDQCSAVCISCKGKSSAITFGGARMAMVRAADAPAANHSSFTANQQLAGAVSCKSSVVSGILAGTPKNK